MRAAGACPLCGVAMRLPTGASDHARCVRTRDHILPRVRGGTPALPAGTNNFRAVCQGCNRDLARAFHCVAVLACAMAVAIDTGETREAVMWRLGILQAGERAAFREGIARARKAAAAERFGVVASPPVTLGDALRADLARAWPGAQA